jgi:hypothetical protein
MERKMKLIPLMARTVLAMTVCSSGWSLANDVATGPPAGPDTAVAIPGLGIPVETGALDASRGGFEIVKNDMQLSGSVANNSTVNVVSGNNLISDGSFTNANGLPMVIQNSGSNVLIQNATIFNVQFK